MFDPNKAPATLPELARRTFTRFAARPYLGQKNKTTKSYQFQSYAQIAARVRNLSGAFLSFDFERGTRIAILAENEANWAIIDLACQGCGPVVVPLFSSLPAGQVETILADCAGMVLSPRRCNSNPPIRSAGAKARIGELKRGFTPAL